MLARVKKSNLGIFKVLGGMACCLLLFCNFWTCLFVVVLNSYQNATAKISDSSIKK